MARKKSATKAAYKPGDLVFCKVRGFSHWPAKIRGPVGSASSVRYSILFFGTHQTFEARTDAIAPYNEETKVRYGSKAKSNKSFAQGMWEIENDPALKLFKPANLENETENESEPPQTSTSSESNFSTDRQSPIKEEKHSTEDDDETAEKKSGTRSRPVRSSKRLRQATEEPAEESLNQPAATVPEKRKTASKPAPVVTKKAKVELDPIKEKLQKKEAWLKLTPEQRKEEVQRLKTSKTNQKRLERIQNVKIQMALDKMASEIEAALELKTPKGFSTCDKILADFVKLPVKANHIHLVPQILEAIQKCKNLKESETKLKQSSQKSLEKINELFELKPGDNMAAIEDMRKKYLEEHKKDIEKDLKLAQKLKLKH